MSSDDFAHLLAEVYEAQPQIGLGLRKELLRRRGAISSAAVRQTAMCPDERALAELDELLAALALADHSPTLE